MANAVRNEIEAPGPGRVEPRVTEHAEPPPEVTETVTSERLSEPTEADPGGPMKEVALLPLDGSITAEAILPPFAKIAVALKLTAVLLRVVNEPEPPGSTDDASGASSEAARYLEQVGADLGARGIAVVRLVRFGEPVAEIARTADEIGAQLIAMTTHGRSGLDRVVYGSVAAAVLRRARVPVLLVRVREVSGS